MGQGGIGGNGSVIWEFVHHMANGAERPLAPGVAGNPNAVGVNANHAIGKDSILPGEIGNPRPGAQDLVPGMFKVTLLYPNAGEATTALANAWVAGRSVILHVPAINRPAAAPLNQAEVQVEW